MVEERKLTDMELEVLRDVAYFVKRGEKPVEELYQQLQDCKVPKTKQLAEAEKLLNEAAEIIERQAERGKPVIMSNEALIKTPECPTCRSHKTRFRLRTKTHVCDVCGTVWTSPENKQF